MTEVKLLDFTLKFVDYSDILELIKKNTSATGKFTQIISINSENLVLMKQNAAFKKLVLSSQTLIPDGAGIVWAAKLLDGKSLKRLPGVELMDRLIKAASGYRLRCLLIGGSLGLAEATAKCYKDRFPHLEIKGLLGIVNLKQPKPEEITAIKHIVSLFKPHLVFIAFGSPQQELWLEQNRHLFPHSLAVGVGGGFAMLSGRLPRAPQLWQQMGLEWLYRLFRQPWRWKRQLKLIKFVFLVLKAKLNK